MKKNESAVADLIKKCQAGELADFLIKNSNLPGKMANLKLAKEVQDIFFNLIDQIGFKKLFNLATTLEKNEHEYVRMVAVRALGAIGKDHYKEVLSHIKVLANDLSWRVREGAAEGIGQLLCFHFDPVYKELNEWASSKIANLQRAAEVGMISMMSYDEPFMKEKTKEILDLIEKLLLVDAEYVFKNTSFAINIAGWKNPSVVLNRINKWINEKKFYSSANVLKIVINSLDSRFGKQNGKEAILILGEVENKLAFIFDDKDKKKIAALIEKVKEKIKS